MKKRTTLVLLILTFAIYASNINVQITAEENNYRLTSLELTPHDPIEIRYDSDFEIFPGAGTIENPYLIEGYNITTTDNIGIHITDTTKYFTVRNCYVDARYDGIYTINVADGTATIINNTCSNNVFGIMLWLSNCSTVANNTCSNNNYGILLSSSDSSTVANNTCSNNSNYGILLSSSDSSTVANNTCSNNYYGIELKAYVGSTVANNMCNNNTCNNNDYGIWLRSSDNSTVANNTCNYNSNYGISLSSSVGSTVANNMCNNNNYYGIYIYYSAFCVVTYNLLQENENYGIYLFFGSANNTIHHNTFVDNYLMGTSQACDYGTDSFWYDSATLEGNYWSDWSGIGSYSIGGPANSFDLYPLDEPVVEYSTVVSTTDKNQLSFTFTLLMLVVPLMLTRIISKKAKKE